MWVCSEVQCIPSQLYQSWVSTSCPETIYYHERTWIFARKYAIKHKRVLTLASSPKIPVNPSKFNSLIQMSLKGKDLKGSNNMTLYDYDSICSKCWKIWAGKMKIECSWNFMPPRQTNWRTLAFLELVSEPNLLWSSNMIQFTIMHK